MNSKTFAQIVNNIFINAFNIIFYYCFQHNLLLLSQTYQKGNIKKRRILTDVREYAHEASFRHCRCDPRCTCIKDIYQETKDKRGIDFTLYEVYDQVIDYFVITCANCLKKENKEEKNDSWIFVGQSSNIPVF